MPLLGIFSKKNKQKTPRAPKSSSSARSTFSQDDQSESLEADYVLSPSASSIPSLSNEAHVYNHSNASQSSAISSKLRFAFRRKPTSSNGHSPMKELPLTPLSETDYGLPSTKSDTFLRPPPSRALLFSGQDGGRRSLSSDRIHPGERPRHDVARVDTNRPSNKPEAHSANKSGGSFFGWAQRERTKSRPTTPSITPQPSSAPPLPNPPDSFNLKSFRHIQTQSPHSGTDYEEALQVPPARPRPRGDSVASDSSQRISVAAFREAQARRSTTNLVVPSTSSPIPRTGSPANTSQRDTVPPRPSRAPSRQDQEPSATASRRAPHRHPIPPALVLSSSDDESEEEEEEESDSDGASPSRARINRERTITRKSAKAKSEIGHRSSSTTHHRQTTSSRSEIGHDIPVRPSPSFSQSTTVVTAAPAATSTVGTRSFSIYRRQRASYSTSELAPNAAAQRASVLAAANAKLVPHTKSRTVSTVDSDTSDSSSSGSSSDSDDAPLASLINPKRPNTSMSNVSTGTAGTARQRTLSKPLIDLTAKANPISGKPEAINAADSSSPSIRLVSPTNINNRLHQLTAGLAKRRSLSSKSESHLPSGATSPSRPPQSPKRSVQLSDTLVARTRPSSPSAPMTFPTNSSPNKQETFTKPIPVKSVTHDNTGFRVVSRPVRNSMDSTPTTPSFSSTSFTQTSTLTSEPEPMKSEESISTAQIRPRPVRHRPTASAFSVVSRPTSSVSSIANDGPSDFQKAQEDRSPRPSPAKSLPASSSSKFGAESSPKTQPSSSLSPLVTSPGYSLPQRPFANQRRQDSPASSTGGSSSGKAPLTPRDGSDYFSIDPRSRNDSTNTSEASAAPSALKGTRAHAKRSSVTFANTDLAKLEKDRGRLVNASSSKDSIEKGTEERRRERRRSEAKASIELGNVINGRGPILDDDEEEDMPIMGNGGPRISMVNPMMNPTFVTNSMNMGAMPMWSQQAMQAAMLNNQQFMIPPPPMNADANFLAAHHQALMIAKQAYQMAVAQQAIAAAGDEWERSSNVSGMGGMGGGSVYGGMSMGGGGWGSQYMFPSGPRSMYAGSVYAGSDAGGGWGSASVYGDTFGPSLTSGDRRSQMLKGLGVGAPPNRGNAFPRSESSGNLGVPMPSRPGARPRTKTAPSGSPLPPQHSGLRAAAPPTSWKQKM